MEQLDKVILVGGSFNRDKISMFKTSSIPIWSVAKIYHKIPYASLVFEMHTDRSRWTNNTYRAYEDGKLIIMNEASQFPNASILPKDKLIEHFGMVFTSSFSWMTAYALFLGVKQISYYGINMIHPTELGTQRDGLLFLLGVAKGKGVEIVAPQDSYLRYGVRL